MSRHLRPVVAAVLIAVSLACASGGSGSAKPRVKPPALLTRTGPELVPVSVTPNAPRPARLVEVEVTVNPDGTPDLSTLKVTGQGAAANRAAITTWVQGLRFAPATQDGIPVAAPYRTSFGMTIRTGVVR